MQGTLEAHNAEIWCCENGTLMCDNLLVNHMGSARAYITNGRIQNLYSNNSLFVQKYLSIGSMISRGNEFILHPCIYGAQKQKLDSMRDTLFNIDRLRDAFAAKGKHLERDSKDSNFLLHALEAKDMSVVDKNLYDWNTNVLNRMTLKRNNIENLFNKYKVLMQNLAEKSESVMKEITQELSKMFNIEVIFKNKCEVDFVVRFVDLRGIERRKHIKASKANAIKKVMLIQADDDVKITCLKN